MLWQGWDRNYELENLSQAGTLTGIGNIGYAKRFELKPFGLAGFEKQEGQETKYPGKVGGDLNVNLSPTLKLNLTANTAQVEADRIAVNLTRLTCFVRKKGSSF